MNAHRLLDPNAEFRVAPNLCALGIMTKAPEPGKVKTRLSPPLTAEEAAALNICFLRDLSQSIAAAAKHSAGRGIGIYTPIGAEESYQGILPPDFFLIPQRGNDFGERLVLAAEDLFTVGFESVCLINSDSPTVPATVFAIAANRLHRMDDEIVLGPSIDGGYYLIGMKRLRRDLFEGIDWSTERVLNQTIERAGEGGVYLLPSGLDVDDQSSLHLLCEELLTENAQAGDIAPETQKFLRELIAREGRERIWPKL